jgi:hypothetical protein
MLSFINEGHIDPVAITTFGVSAKESEDAIGYFGTGLKYAIAVVLRLGGKVTVWQGTTPYEFGVQTSTVRGKDFDTVTMNGEPLGFTTHLGVNWEPWQAYRELYCNARDEPGSRVEPRRRKPRDGYTTIHVSGCEAMMEAHATRDKIFLPSKPLAVTPGVEIHPGESGHLYYQGVRVHELNKPTLFTYNLTGHQALTEDRTLRYPFIAEANIRTAWLAVEDEGLLDTLFTRAVPECFEMHGLEFERAAQPPGEAFAAVALRYLKDPKYPLARSLVRYLQAHSKDAALAESVTPTKAEQRVLDRALRVCEHSGHPVGNYDVRLANSLGTGTLGLAIRGANVIMISRTAFTKGPTCVVGTLLEEFIHLEHGLDDESRGLQDYLVDLAANQAEQLYAMEEA